MPRALLLTLPLWATMACSSEPARVTIPPGSTLRAAADSLRSAGVIRWKAAFRAYAKVTGRDRVIRPGTFLLSPHAMYGTILDSLTRGRGLSITITVPEGFRMETIEQLLAEKLELKAEDVAAATHDSALVARLGIPGTNLEGYLFPDTYFFPIGTDARSAVTAMIERFEQAWDSTWDARLDTLERTRHEIITLASIVEKEVSVGEERPVVAAVYHNRLRIGMALQADPTVLYARGEHAERVYLKDLEIDSPYNTYRYPDLPPGPIASPGEASIRAALYPSDVNYLYFVAHPDGHHEFRSTYAEHLRAKAALDRLRREGGR